MKLTRRNNLASLVATQYSATTPTSSWRPDEMIASWSEDGTTISFPIASLSTHKLTAALADGSTGDARQVIASLCGAMFEWYNDLTTKPTALEASFNPRRPQTSGNFLGKPKHEYKFTFYVDFPEQTITDEP